MQDVTELRDAQDELRLSEERFRTAFNAGGAGMVMSDHEGRYVEANRAFCDFVGYELRELQQLTSRDLTHPDDRPIYDELRDRLRSEDRVNIREKRYVRKDGETVWAITTGARVVDPRTGDVVVISNVQDITGLKTAQDSLAENEARFRGVFDLGAAGVIVVSPEGALLEYNRAFADFLGYSDDELIGKKAFNFMHPEDRERGVEDRKRLYAGEVERINVERRFFHRYGRILWAQLGVSVMQIPGLDPVQVVMVQDITDRKSDAEALARSTKLLDLVREVALAANQNISFNDVVQFSLDRVCAFTGWPVGHAYVMPENEEALLEPMRAWYLDDAKKYESFRHLTETYSVDRKRQLAGEVLDTGNLVWREQLPIDLSNVGPRGKLIQEVGLKSGFATPVKAGDQTVGVLEFFSNEYTERDEGLADALIQVGTELGRVFERQRADRVLQTREEQLRQIIDNAPLWIYVKDREGRYLIANKAVADNYGVTADALIGHKQDEFYDYPDEMERIRKTDLDVIKANRPNLFRESKVWNAKGEQRDMRIFKLPFTAHDGSTAVLGIGTDITDEKRAESELWRVQRMDALGHMTGGVAHDFNNLLTIILGNLQLLCRRITDPSILALAETAERAARRGGDVTNRLLAFARSQPLAPQATEISKLIDDTFPLLERSVGVGVKVEKRLAPDLWWAQVDPGQLENALINLAVNARDAMPDGGRIAIKAENFRLKRRTRKQKVNLVPGEYVRISVQDNGSGMAEEVLARAFEPFFTTKAFGDGSGLGLSTVYGFAEQSGGSVSIDTQLGRGTTVNLFLPQAESIKTIVSSALPIETEGEKESILLVEDNADVRAFAATVLDNLNYTVIEAENGDDALVMFEKMPIDLLFSDVLLPGSLNGKALARTILARDPTLPVVLASGNWDLANSGGTSDVPEEAIVLQKPYTATQLSAIIQKLFDEQKSGRVGS